MPGLELLHDERLQDRMALDPRPLDQLPPAAGPGARPPGRSTLGGPDLPPPTHLIHAPHPRARGGVGAHAHARREALEDGGEPHVLGEAQDDGDAVVDLVADDVGAVLGEEGVGDDVVQVDGPAREALQVGVGPDEGLVGVQVRDDLLRVEGRREGKAEF